VSRPGDAILQSATYNQIQSTLSEYRHGEMALEETVPLDLGYIRALTAEVLLLYNLFDNFDGNIYSKNIGL